LVRISRDTSYHASDAVLELTVRRGVDERVDTAADEHKYLGKLVEPGNGVNVLTQE